MTAPINNPSVTTVTTTSTSAPETTTTVTFGNHTVSTTATGTTQTTATTTSSLANTTIPEHGSQDAEVQSAMYSPETAVTTQAPESGATGQTAATTGRLGLQILRPHAASVSSIDSEGSETEGIDDGGIQQQQGTQGAHESQDTQGPSGASGQASEIPESLSNLKGSEAAEGAARPDGPGGTPDMSIPTYDPTNKASIIQFLSNPAVQAKIQTKGGHLVYVDQDRGSFIFVRNGDWSTAESVLVSNGKTKDPVTNPKDLEMCVAKFCMSYETIQNDWETNIHPNIAAKAGESGKYDHLLLSFKFRTAVLYGPWNSQESSAGYTPSVWRRGTKVDAGAIWDDVGGLHPVNWNNVAKPAPMDSVSFQKEQPAPAPMGMPVINVNLGGISTNVSVGGPTTTTTVETPAPTPTPVEDDAASVSSESTQVEADVHIDEPGVGEDDLAPPPPPEEPAAPPPSTNPTGMDGPSLKDILANVRQHLDTVYDSEGNHHEGNQDLGTVVKSSENGTYQPTVLLDKPTEQTAPSQQPSNELGDILKAVRQHLDVVYPEGNGGEPISTNQSLGDVIAAVEAGQTPEPTKPEGIFHAQRVEISDDDDASSVDGDSSVSDTDSTPDASDVSDAEGAAASSDVENTETEAPNTNGTSSTAAPEPSPDNELANTLQAVRQHLDVVYPEGSGGEPIAVNQNLGQVIKDVSSGQGAQPTVPTGASSATQAASAPTPQAGPRAGSGGIAQLTKGGALAGPGTLEKLLPQIRAHLDEAFDQQGNLTQTSSPTLGNIISDFRSRTGSGGLEGISSAPQQAAQHVVVSSPVTQQSSVTESVNAASPQTAAPLTGSGSLATTLDLAEGSNRLNSILNSTPSGNSQGLSLLAAATEVAQSLSSALDSVTKND